jgi:hypothetical protein
MNKIRKDDGIEDLTNASGAATRNEPPRIRQSPTLYEEAVKSARRNRLLNSKGQN